MSATSGTSYLQGTTICKILEGLQIRVRGTSPPQGAITMFAIYQGLECRVSGTSALQGAVTTFVVYQGLGFRVSGTLADLNCRAQ